MDKRKRKHDRGSDEHTFKRNKRDHGDGYKRESDRSLDLKVAAGDTQSMSSLVPLASKPAARTDLDLYYNDTHKIYHNGGYTNILNNFKTVDNQSKTKPRSFEQGLPDYYVATYKVLMPAYLNTEYSNYSVNNNSYYVWEQQQIQNSSTTGINLTCWMPGTISYTINGATIKPYQSYITQKNRDRNVWFQGLYNKFSNNTSFSTIQAMNPTVYSCNDTSPYNYNSMTEEIEPKINTLMAQGDAVNANMLYLVQCLRMYKITKVLLKRFSDRHMMFSNYISQAISGISTLRYVTLLEKCSDLLSKMPCDIKYIENYSKRIIPSLTGDSYYDPILIPNGNIVLPEYQIQGEGGSAFTPVCFNENYLQEQDANTLTSDGYTFKYTNGSGDVTEVEVPAGYPIIVDSSNNLYYYNGATSTTALPQGGYKTGLTAPFGVHTRYVGLQQNITAQYLLQQLQLARNGTSFETSAMTSVNAFRENWLTFLQTLADNIARFNVMMAPFASMYELIEKSGLAKYHAKRGEGDIDVSAHYDGGLGDGIKHPEACITSINNVASQALTTNTGLLNAHQQYSTGIALHYTYYDEHIVDSNAMYSIVGQGYYCTNVTEYGGFNILIAPFTDAVKGQSQDNGISPDAFDNNGVSLNTYMLPKAVIDGLVNVYSYYGDANVGQVTDADTTTLQSIMSCSPSTNGQNSLTQAANIIYPQAGVCVGVYNQSNNPNYFFAMQYSLRVFGVIAILQSALKPGGYGKPAIQQVKSLFTAGYTSYLPLTAYNDMPLYYDEAVSEHPFTVTTKQNAQKVVQVAE